MALTEASGLSASDVLALTNKEDGFGFGGMGGWWIILFILLLGGGFGNGWSNNNAFNYGNEIQRGFDQSAVITALGNLNTAITNGFAGQQIDACNKAMSMQMQLSNDKFDTISTLNQGHNNILQQMGVYEMARQQCCCDNKAAIADLKYTVATENCADRNALQQAVWNLGQQMNAGFQGLRDEFCQDRLAAKDALIADLTRQVNALTLQASQTAQNQFIAANNQMQTDTIMNYLNPPYARAYPPTAVTAASGG